MPYFNYKPRFNYRFSRNTLLTIKDGAYVINVDDNKSKGTHWVSLFFDFFGIEYILEKVLNKIKDNSITPKTPRIQDNDSIM